jgi:hypothetical protein
MRSFLKILIVLGCFFAAACGVKKYPDVYYRHPMQYDGLNPSGSPSVTPSPVPGEYTPPTSTPSLIPHE